MVTAMTRPPRKDFDLDAYIERSQNSPCFICGIVNRDAEYADREVIHDDGDTIAFLNDYPTLLGYSLVCPKRHAEDITTDVTETEYLAIQTVVRKVARALTRVVPTERVYVMSLGSMTGNAHIHWHVAPLPPGVPYREQQFHALRIETAGVLDLDPAAKADLARRLRAELA